MADPDELFRRAHDWAESYENFKLFFNAVGLWINQEIDIENSKLGIARLVGATKRPVKKVGLSSPILEIKYGERTCLVSFNRRVPAIEANIEDTESSDLSERRETRFRLDNQQSGARALMIESANGETAEKVAGPQEVAKAVVVGVVRGYFA